MIVKFFGILRDSTQKPSMEVPVEGEMPLREVLSTVITDYPELENILYDQNGAIRSSIVITLNGFDLSCKDISDVAVHDDDEVAIFPAFSGGTSRPMPWHVAPVIMGKWRTRE